MTAARLHECLALLGWSQRGLADLLAINEKQVRRWASGDYAVPATTAAWLDRLAQFHALNPPPTR